MPFRLQQTFVVELTLSSALPLSSIEQHRAALQRSGIYVIHEALPPSEHIDAFSPSVFYIGKAIGETIYERCRKHRTALSQRGVARADGTMKPGKRFREFRDALEGEMPPLFVAPGFMEKSSPHLISCAEEYLILMYEQQHGHKPRGNTK